MNHDAETIIACPVPGNRRTSLLPENFGARAALAVESAVHDRMRRPCSRCTGSCREYIAVHRGSAIIRRASD